MSWIIQFTLTLFQKLAGPVLIYLKGRADATKAQELKADEQFIKKVSVAHDAAVDAGRVHNKSTDPNNRDNKR